MTVFEKLTLIANNMQKIYQAGASSSGGGGGVTPSGTIGITENGTYDVKQYARAEVTVPIPEGYIQPSGSVEYTENGTYDITDKAQVIVNVANSGGEQPTPQEITVTIGVDLGNFALIHNDTTYTNGSFKAMTGDTLYFQNETASQTVAIYLNGEHIGTPGHSDPTTWVIPNEATSVTISDYGVLDGYIWQLNITYTTESQAREIPVTVSTTLLNIIYNDTTYTDGDTFTAKTGDTLYMTDPTYGSVGHNLIINNVEFSDVYITSGLFGWIIPDNATSITFTGDAAVTYTYDTPTTLKNIGIYVSKLGTKVKMFIDTDDTINGNYIEMSGDEPDCLIIQANEYLMITSNSGAWDTSRYGSAAQWPEKCEWELVGNVIKVFNIQEGASISVTPQ